MTYKKPNSSLSPLCVLLIQTATRCSQRFNAYFKFEFIDCRQNPAHCAVTTGDQDSPGHMRQQQTPLQGALWWNLRQIYHLQQCIESVSIGESYTQQFSSGHL